MEGNAEGNADSPITLLKKGCVHEIAAEQE